MSNFSQAPEQRASNLRFDFGEVALDASNPTPVTTKLNTILVAVVTIKNASAPGLATTTVTYAFSGKSLNIYAWTPSTADPTLAASSGTETVGYIVFGY